MGYSTEYRGELKFTSELTGKELGHLKKYFGEDCRDHPKWKGTMGNFDSSYYIQLEFLDDFSGIKWDGAEKTNGMVEQVNFLLQEMKKIKPTFGFKGSFMCQGEEMTDRWMLVFQKNGIAKRKDITIKGDKVTCPNCEVDFILED